jgi:hypothetical protein
MELIRYQTTNLIKAKKGTSLLEFGVWKGSYENSWHEFKDLEDALTSWKDTIQAANQSGSAYSEP